MISTDSARSFVLRDCGYSFAFHKVDRIPLELTTADNVGMVLSIDLTETGFRDFEGLKCFTKLETLILDKNDLPGLLNCPVLPTVKTLWFNNNCIEDLTVFMDEVVVRFPNLLYLSVMRNPACPGMDSAVSSDLEAIRLYRLYILFRYPALVTLDWSNVADEERSEALVRGQYAVLKKPKTTSGLDSPQSDQIIIVGTYSDPNAPESKSQAAYRGKVPGFDTPATRLGTSRMSEGNRFIVNNQL